MTKKIKEEWKDDILKELIIIRQLLSIIIEEQYGFKVTVEEKQEKV